LVFTEFPGYPGVTVGAYLAFEGSKKEDAGVTALGTILG